MGRIKLRAVAYLGFDGEDRFGVGSQNEEGGRIATSAGREAVEGGRSDTLYDRIARVGEIGPGLSE